MRKLKKYVWPVLCMALLVVVLFQELARRSQTRKADVLLGELENYRVNKDKSDVVERISKQMEDIAYQQKNIAEQQREEALFQMGMAEKMRQRAESEQQKAEASALVAAEARNMAELQREVAVQQQRQAERARNVADTLSMLALARSLSFLSSTQARGGNIELANLLACVAWQFTSDYKGDLYQPALFNALRLSGEGFTSYNLHQGGVTRIIRLPASGATYCSVSDYGEIRRWQEKNEEVVDVRLLFADPTCSFRDICIDGQNRLYALAYDGRLVVLDGDSRPQTILLPETKGWMRVCPFDGNLLLASATHLYIYDTDSRAIAQAIPLAQPLSALGFRNGHWLAFGKNGGLWIVGTDGTLTPQDRWGDEEVTSYVWSDSQQIAAIGTESGDIYLTDSLGNTIRRLVGHRSRITQLCFRGNYLYSASYDCLVNLWNVSASRQEAVSLHQFSAWVRSLYLSQDNILWVGDESGSVSRLVTSPVDMVTKIRSRLKRDFTDDEWDYYVGAGVPRRAVLVNPSSDI